MKTHHKIVAVSAEEKTDRARQLKKSGKLEEAAALYTKAIFLNEDPEYLLELADIYEMMMDLSTALNLHKRAEQLRGSQSSKIKSLALLRGFALLDAGSVKNILSDCEHQEFKEKYPSFRGRLEELAQNLPEIRINLLNCLSYLECDYRMFALEELQ